MLSGSRVLGGLLLSLLPKDSRKPKVHHVKRKGSRFPGEPFYDSIPIN